MLIRKILFNILFLLISLYAFSQHKENYYFDSNWKPVKSNSNYTYYRVIEYDKYGDLIMPIKDYWRNGTLQGEFYSDKYDKEGIKHSGRPSEMGVYNGANIMFKRNGVYSIEYYKEGKYIDTDYHNRFTRVLYRKRIYTTGNPFNIFDNKYSQKKSYRKRLGSPYRWNGNYVKTKINYIGRIKKKKVAHGYGTMEYDGCGCKTLSNSKIIGEFRYGKPISGTLYSAVPNGNNCVDFKFKGTFNKTGFDKGDLYKDGELVYSGTFNYDESYKEGYKYFKSGYYYYGDKYLTGTKFKGIEGTFKDDVPNGICSLYNRDGSLFFTDKWENGVSDKFNEYKKRLEREKRERERKERELARKREAKRKRLLNAFNDAAQNIAEDLQNSVCPRSGYNAKGRAIDFTESYGKYYVDIEATWIGEKNIFSSEYTFKVLGQLSLNTDGTNVKFNETWCNNVVTETRDNNSTFSFIAGTALVVGTIAAITSDSDNETSDNNSTNSSFISCTESTRNSTDLYILSIGTDPDIEADNDAIAIRDRLSEGCGESDLFGNIYSITLTNHNATRNKILNAFNEIKRETNENDIFLLFFSGHGGGGNGSRFVFGTSKYEGSYVTVDEIVTGIDADNCKTILWFDACHAGQVENDFRNNVDNYIRNKYLPNVTILMSSSDNESSYGDSYSNLGFFTKTIIDGLDGEADNNNNRIVSLDEICYYVIHEVPKRTSASPRANTQHPRLLKEGKYFNTRLSKY